MSNLTIGQVAARAGVNVETVRFYERQGLIDRPGKPESGFRRYSPEVVVMIRFIRRAKDLGFSLREISELLAFRRHSEGNCEHVRQQAELKIDAIADKIDALTRMRDALQGLVAACQERGHLGECPILETLEAGREGEANASGVDDDETIRRLRNLLPLTYRQRQLPPDGRLVHRAILRSFADTGRPLAKEDISKLTPDPPSLLARLRREDLVVLGAGGELLGAYPFTLEETPHRLTIDGRDVYAMCAFDALAVSPTFETEVLIHSRCCMSGESIRLRQKGFAVVQEKPLAEILLGIRWRQPGACAAHSICREMVFLKGRSRARQWQEDEPEVRGIFPLEEAVRLAAAFFRPLLQD